MAIELHRSQGSSYALRTVVPGHDFGSIFHASGTYLGLEKVSWTSASSSGVSLSSSSPGATLIARLIEYDPGIAGPSLPYVVNEWWYWWPTSSDYVFAATAPFSNYMAIYSHRLAGTAAPNPIASDIDTASGPAEVGGVEINRPESLSVTSTRPGAVWAVQAQSQEGTAEVEGSLGTLPEALPIVVAGVHTFNPLNFGARAYADILFVFGEPSPRRGHHLGLVRGRRG